MVIYKIGGWVAGWLGCARAYVLAGCARAYVLSGCARAYVLSGKNNATSSAHPSIPLG